MHAQLEPSLVRKAIIIIILFVSKCAHGEAMFLPTLQCALYCQRAVVLAAVLLCANSGSSMSAVPVHRLSVAIVCRSIAVRQPTVARLAPARKSAREVRDDVVAGLANARFRTLQNGAVAMTTASVVGALDPQPARDLEVKRPHHDFPETRGFAL